MVEVPVVVFGVIASVVYRLSLVSVAVHDLRLAAIHTSASRVVSAAAASGVGGVNVARRLSAERVDGPLTDRKPVVSEAGTGEVSLLLLSEFVKASVALCEDLNPIVGGSRLMRAEPIISIDSDVVDHVLSYREG